MGLFKARDPHKNIYSSSGGRILSREIDGTVLKYLLLIGFSAKPDNKDVRIISLDLENTTPAFTELAQSFLEQFNKQFPQGADTRTGLDYLTLPEWPNYNIVKPDHPSQIGQSELIEKDFTGNQVSQKRTTILVFTRADKVGKFFALRKKAGGTFMEEIFDLKVSKDEDAGLALWTVSPSALNVFSSFFMDVYFTAGSNKFDKVLLGIPTRQASVPFGMALASSGMK